MKAAKLFEFRFCRTLSSGNSAFHLVAADLRFSAWTVLVLCCTFFFFFILSKPARNLNKSSDPPLRLCVCVRITQTDPERNHAWLQNTSRPNPLMLDSGCIKLTHWHQSRIIYLLVGCSKTDSDLMLTLFNSSVIFLMDFRSLRLVSRSELL